MRTPTRSAVVALTVVALSIASLSGAAAAAEDVEGIHISEVDVTPENPETGEAFTVTATVRNDGETRFDLRQVSLVGVEDPASARNLGTLAPDAEIDVSMSTEFESPGTKEFRVRASGNADEIGVVHQPVTVDVGEPSSYIEVSAEEAFTDTWVPVDVEVSNGGEQVRNVRAHVEGDVAKKEDQVFTPMVPENDTETLTLNVMSNTDGVEPVTVVVSYTNSNDNTVELRSSEVIEFTGGSHDVELTASGSEDGVEATVVNRGDAAVHDVTVRTSGPASTAEIDVVRGGSSETAELDVTGVESATAVNLTAEYYLGTEMHTAETSVDYTPPSYVRLTGVSVDGSGTLTITGSASNVGVQNAEGVLVEVEDTEEVDPAQPQSDFFVGTVPGSDFGTFELNAEVVGDTEEIPVRLSYIADGERYSRTVDIPYGGGARAPETFDEGSQDSSGLDEEDGDGQDDSGVPTSVVVLSIAVVAGVMAYGWRKRDGG